MKPNILFITADQHRANAVGFENPEVYTPHLDALASSGTRFATCITPSLVCQPARASILTGLLPLNHGVRDNGIDLPPSVGQQGFAARLADHGYRTAMFGKAHFSTKSTFSPTGTPEDRFNGALYETGWSGPYMGFEQVELAVLGHFHKTRPPKFPVVGHWEKWFLGQGGDGRALREWSREVKPGNGAAQTWESALRVGWHSSSWIADRTIEWLTRYDREKPFCAWVSFPDPHHPFDCPLPWSRLHEAAKLSLPEHRKLDLDRRPWWHRASLEGKPALADDEMRRFREQGSRVPTQTDAQLAEMTANYYGMISLVDHNVGRIVEALASQGLSDETYIVYSSDHGDMLGHHGLYLKGPTPYDDILRVPLIVSGPGVKQGAVVQEPVSTLDLAATFAEWADIDGGIGQGRSVAALSEGDNEKRDGAYSEWHVHESRCGVALQLHTVRTSDYKLTLEKISGDGELYHMQSDPDEMNNLFSHPSAQAIQSELTALLEQRLAGPISPLLEHVGMA